MTKNNDTSIDLFDFNCMLYVFVKAWFGVGLGLIE